MNLKRTLFLLIFALTPVFLWSQSIGYQAIIRNNSNALITESEVGIKISILQGSTTGSVIYSETHMITTNSYGLATLYVGEGNLESGVYSSIDWGATTYFLKSEVDPDGGTNYIIETTSQVLSVPKAVYAEEAGQIKNAPITGDYSQTFRAIFNQDTLRFAGSSNNLGATDMVSVSSISGNRYSFNVNTALASFTFNTVLTGNTFTITTGTSVSLGGTSFVTIGGSGTVVDDTIQYNLLLYSESTGIYREIVINGTK